MKRVAETELNATSAAPVSAPSPALTSRRLQASQLFGGARELVIEHAGEDYRLRITQLGKLILTK